MTESPRGRRLLFIAYEFPPSAGGGVQRTTKFARYLSEEGWAVQVVTAEPLRGRPQDATLLAEVQGIPVVRLKARHVASAFARLLAPFKGLRPTAKQSASHRAGPIATGYRAPKRPLSSRLARWIAVPDDAVLWSRSVPAAAARLHGEASFDVVIATGPPYSALVAGVRAAARLGVPAVVDLRDAWKNAYAADWPMRWQARRYVELEREVMGAAATALGASQAIVDEMREMGAGNALLLTNGFDAEVMPTWRPRAAGPLHLAFLGRFSPGTTDPTELFAALARARELDARFGQCRLEVVGPEAPWLRSLAEELRIDDMVQFQGYKPYREALESIATADYGVVVLKDAPSARGVYSGKVFDYVGIGLPVLVFGPETSGAAELAHETGCGVVISSHDVDTAARILIALAEAKRSGAALCAPDPAVRARYERRAQVHRLSALLDAVVSGRQAAR